MESKAQSCLVSFNFKKILSSDTSSFPHFCDVFTDYLKVLNANKAVIEKKYKIEFYWQIKQRFFCEF